METVSGAGMPVRMAAAAGYRLLPRMNAIATSLRSLLLALATLLALPAANVTAESRARPAHLQPPSLARQLERFRLEALASVEVADATGTDRRLRAFSYEVAIDGPKLRIEISSEGAEIGVLPRTSLAYDGRQTWVRLPCTDIVSVRTGEWEGPLPVSIPDPLLLQFRALLALEDAAATRGFSLRDLGRDHGLLDRLESSAWREAALAASNAAGDVAVTTAPPRGGGLIEIHWRQEGARWVPQSFKGSGLWGGSGSVEWVVLESLPSRAAGGIAGIPRRMEYRASDSVEGPLSELRIRFEVRAFEPGFAADADLFSLEAASLDGRLWDEDAGMFLRK